MQIAMIGLGRKGAQMVKRLSNGGHQCVVFDKDEKAMADAVDGDATKSDSLEDFAGNRQRPRAIWLMVPAAVVDKTFGELSGLLEAQDIVIDGGNSYYVDDIRMSKELAARNIHYLDAETSGGVWVSERGYGTGVSR